MQVIDRKEAKRAIFPIKLALLNGFSMEIARIFAAYFSILYIPENLLQKRQEQDLFAKKVCAPFLHHPVYS